MLFLPLPGIAFAVYVVQCNRVKACFSKTEFNDVLCFLKDTVL